MDTTNLISTNSIDIIILAIFFLSILIGFGRGLVSEILSLIVLVAAFIVGIVFTGSLATYFASTPAMQNVMSGSSTAAAEPATYVVFAISFAILFVITYIIGCVVKLLLNMMFTASGFGFVNRLLGAIFGFVRGYLINLVLIFLITLSPFAMNDTWKKSKYVPLFQPQVAWLANVVSPKLANLKSTFDAAIKNTSDKAKESTEQNKVDENKPTEETTTVPLSVPMQSQ